MNDKPKTITRLADYTPPAYLVDTIHLEFQLFDDFTQVRARLALYRNPDPLLTSHQPLCLDGRELELVQIHLDGEPLLSAQFEITDEHLVLHHPPAEFVLETVSRIQPQKNLSLEGLYRSGSLFCTQCEAEGFRKITYYPDRPDVMARFTVTIEADLATCPVLLANGNLKESGPRPNNRHFAKWEDPFPKPAYLFALVAGNLLCHSGTFITRSGRDTTLQIWVEPENIHKCQHALESLQKAMAWDEERFGCEYDLDLYMIVAVNDFNMGAMENKGLNLFNAQYVLADPQTATDANYQEIESVIGHEYFHNWTGNRITCRDWFQLSLKEGLTIFRDQEFSSDVGSRSGQRIRDVHLLRTYQFPEDAGPTAHPVRPEAYMEINNFYTMTVYNKGAEVVRMIQTLIGQEQFRQGMDLYFARHDGQAVTVEAFIAAMEHASKRDLTQFRRWYQQPGTPELTIQWQHDPARACFEITISQGVPTQGTALPAQPLHMPIRLALLHPITGTPLPLTLTSDAAPPPTERILELTCAQETFCFINIDTPPIPSVLRGFSAPVKIKSPLSAAELAFLWGADQDPFNRWDAGQTLATQVLLETARTPPAQKSQLPTLFLAAFAATLQATQLEPALIALALTLPGLNLLIDNRPDADPGALHQARESVRQQLAIGCQEVLYKIHAANQTPGPYQRTPEAIGRRSLKNLVLGYLMALPDHTLPAQMASEQIHTTDNMTDRLGALTPLVHANHPESQAILEALETRWCDNPLAMNKWFAIQASAPLPDALDRVKELMKNKKFDISNPNKVRAVIGTFCQQNLSQFHNPSGLGYQFLVEQIQTLDPLNPQIAARLTGALTRWRHFEPLRRQAMQTALQDLLNTPNLSRNTYEIASKSLI